MARIPAPIASASFVSPPETRLLICSQHVLIGEDIRESDKERLPLPLPANTPELTVPASVVVTSPDSPKSLQALESFSAKSLSLSMSLKAFLRSFLSCDLSNPIYASYCIS